MRILLIVAAAFSILSCSNRTDNYVPENTSQKEMDANLWSVIRYLARSPEGLTPPERFYAAYDSFYYAQTKLHKVEAWFKKDGTDYFLISRMAPSLLEKRVATGGKVKYDADGKVEEYEEVFRTWKMLPDTLTKRSLFLFDKMVKGEPLKQYETRFSNGVEYIEFPDENTFYDKADRTWKTK